MRSDGQLDLLRHSDQALVRANRAAAEAALVDPHWSPEQAQLRAAHYLAVADQIEARGHE